MSLAVAIWHALPAWTWGGMGLVGVGLVAAALLGFWPVIRGFISTIVGMVPWDKWQTWALIGAAVAAFGFKVWLDLHDQALLAGASRHEDAAVAGRDTYWKGEIKASNDRYAAQLASLQAYIDGERAKAQAAADKLRADAEAERAKARRAADELEKRRSENVTEAAARLCTVTRGMVLQFNGGAAYANGGDELAVAAASAGAGLPAASATGISLDSYTRAVEDAQRALRTCRAQVIGWQRYDAEVIEPWVATAIEAANRCTPKGSP